MGREREERGKRKEERGWVQRDKERWGREERERESRETNMSGYIGKSLWGKDNPATRKFRIGYRNRDRP